MNFVQSISLLTLENYLDLQKEIERINPDENVSALYLYLWKYYDAYVHFKVNPDSIYLYVDLRKSRQIGNNHISGWYVIKPIVKNEKNLFETLKKAITFYTDCFSEEHFLFLDRIPTELLPLFNKYELISVSDVGYLYETDQLKYFKGNKMQKKRNLLNYYVKNFGDNTKVYKYDEKYFKEVLNFCEAHIRDSDPTNFRIYEFEAIKELLEVRNPNLVGSVMFYENKLVGVTLGYIHGNFYEIFLEKAIHEYKGSYQFLISQNLLINNINTNLIDRQDSESLSGLVQSKRSYKPIKIIEGNSLRINLYDY